MENKDKNKKSSFFEKEGFYVILFVCLCIAAVVTALTTKNSKKVVNKAETAQVQQSNTQEEQKNTKEENNASNVTKDEKQKEVYNNAMQVKKNNQNKAGSNKNVIEPVKDGGKSLSVSKSTDPQFSKPLNGEVVMKYSLVPIHWETSNTDRPHFGINIKAKEGTPVKCAADGEVKAVEDGTFGVTVVVYHKQYDKRTVYANLDKKVMVKVGDKVEKGKQVGKVGTTAVRGSNEKYGKEFLHFEVLKGSKGDAQFTSENPEKYVKY